MNTCLTYNDFKIRYAINGRKFKRLILPIIEDLEKVGYKNGQRTFTPKQSSIIIEYLG
jgi:hypothetical protein